MTAGAPIPKFQRQRTGIPAISIASPARRDGSGIARSYDTWPHVVGSYDVGTIEDIRALAGYQAAKDARALIVEGPRPNPDTGFPVIILRVPIIKDGAFVGCASANITLDVLSRFLTSHRASPHSTTVIANPTEGTIISYPDPKKRRETRERPAGNGQAGYD